MSYDMEEAFKHLAILTDYIEASAKMLQKSFKMFGDPTQIQARPIQTETLNNTNERENAVSYNSKRKRELDSLEAFSSGIKKCHKETEDKLHSNETVCPDNIIVNDNGNTGSLTSKINTDELILIQTKTLDKTNERENMLSYNGKRKRETDVSEACGSGIKKSHKGTEDKPRPNKTECPETIIISEKGIAISQNIDRITSEKNRGSVILSRDQTDKLGDGLLFNPMTKPSTRTDVIALSQKYVDDFLKTTGIELTYRKKTVNCECNCVCLGP